MGALQRAGGRVGAWVFAIGFSLILLCCLPTLFAGGAWLLAVPVLLCAALVLWRLLGRLSQPTCTRLFFSLLVLWAAAVLWLGWLLRLQHSWDFGQVYEGALELWRDGRITIRREYFLASSNNLFITVVLAAWFRLCSIVGLPPMAAGIGLNVLALAVSMLFLFFAVRRFWDARFALFTAAFCFFFSPMVLYAPVFYTDTLSMPFVCFGLWCFVRAANAPTTRAQLGWGALTGLSAGVGYLAKASVGILLVAGLITGLLRHGRRVLWFALAATGCVALVLGGWQLLFRSNIWLDTTAHDHYRLPGTHYVMMGLKDNGGYNPEDHGFSSAFETLAERKAANIEEIGARLRAFGFGGTLRHLQQKAAYTWADGTYYAPAKLSQWPIAEGAPHEWITPQGRFYGIYHGLATAGQALLLGLMAAGALVAAARKKAVLIDLFFLVRLAVFGLALFLLVWETRSRYLVNFAPLLALLAAGAVVRLDGRLPKPLRRGKGTGA